ncbi:hypothetical protein HDU78_002435 [Chytriomyces hyalinus]|nr:hypothetical protein HDU78_002435 [Chytriomyces hyalinus]
MELIPNLEWHEAPSKPAKPPATTFQSVPTELIAMTLAWIHPRKVLQFRRICKQINSLLLSHHFAILNLRRFMPLCTVGLNPLDDSIPPNTPTSTTTSNQIGLSHLTSSRFIPTVSTLADELDSLWFTWPPNYQRAYIDAKLGRLVEIAWNRLQIQVASMTRMFGELYNLCVLDLRFCPIQGNLPSELGQMSALHVLKLACNNLSGFIPRELGALANLQVLVLAGNHLTGSVPAELGSLINLETLDLSTNKLSGMIPKELGQLLNLRTLDLSGNQLSGYVPTELSDLVNLYRLCLEGNKLRGRIPAEFTKLVKLEVLILTGNRMSLLIPPLDLARGSRLWSLILENGLPLMTFFMVAGFVLLLSVWHLRVLHVLFFGKPLVLQAF